MSVATSRPALTLSIALATSVGTTSTALADFGRRQIDPTYLIDTWETEQGMPENSATAMVQTADGYLWFGTFGGLVRFDGVRFTVFDPSNTPQLPSQGVVNLHLDRAGRLWVSTYRGVVVMNHDADDGHMTWRPISASDGWVGNYARTFAERPNGDLLVTTFDGSILEWSGDRFTRLPTPPGKPGEGYLGVVDETGRWFVAQEEFIGRWDGSQWIPTADFEADHLGASGCAAARDGGVWVLVGRELRKHRGDAVTARRLLPTAPRDVWTLFEDTRGNVWITTSQEGVYRLAPNGDMQRWDVDNGLDHNGTRFAFEDREGNIWIGTSGGGLNRFRPRRFRVIGTESGLAGRNVKSVSADADGSVWVATYGEGVFRLRDGAVTRVSIDGAGENRTYAESVLNDRAGRTWVGVFEHGLFVRDAAQEVAQFRQIPPEQTGGATIIALWEDSRGRVWSAGGHAISVFDGSDFRVYASAQGLPDGNVCAFAEDAGGAIWVSNLNGVFMLDGDRFVEVRDADGAAIPNVVCLRGEPDDSMWMGTTTGLLRWRHDRLGAPGQPGLAGQAAMTTRLDRIDERVGLPIRFVFAIAADDDGFWWLSSNKGVVRARRTDLDAVADGRSTALQCQLLGSESGLASIDCAGGHQPVCTKDLHGRLWFATANGVAVVDPAAFSPNVVPPPVQIETVAYDGARATPDADGDPYGSSRLGSRSVMHGPFRAAMSLPAGSRRLEIHYTGLSFVAPEKVRFQTMLEGRDVSWHDVGTRRVAYYDDLEPREYRFRVRAANDDGAWNETGATLAFVMQPFAWQTWWFRAGAILALLAGAAGVTWRFAHARLVRIRERLELQEQRSELAHLSRVTMLGELSGSLAHELNQPLTAILSNAQAAQRFLARDPIDVDELREILGDIVEQDKRAGEVIRRLRVLFKKGETEHRPLDACEVVRDALRLMRNDLMNHDVTVQTELADDLPPVSGDRVQLQQVLLNLVMNGCDALRDVRGVDRRLIVRAASDDGRRVRISVSDSGVGIAPERIDRVFEPFFSTKDNGLGLGLAVCRTIIRSHHGELGACNNPDRGATFHFTLPASAGADRLAGAAT